MDKLIEIIIPNYNGVSHLQSCLPSLFNQTYKNFKVKVIDNASNDLSVKFIIENFPQVEIIELKRNYGFAKAVNSGIKSALINNEVDFIVLLNNDIECDTNLLRELVNGFKNSDIGSVACKMLNFYDRNLIDDTGIVVKLRGLPYSRGNGEIDRGQYDKDEYIFGACGGAVIYRKEVISEVGYFDEDFISYYEDVDYSFRLQSLGYKCLFNPKAICYHKRGGTANLDSPYRSYLCERNLVAVRVKHYPLWVLVVFSPIYFIARFRRYFFDIFKRSLKEVLYEMWGYLIGLWGIPRSIKKRIKIRGKKKVTDKYILSLLE
jgi:hypothetical protein